MFEVVQRWTLVRVSETVDIPGIDLHVCWLYVIMFEAVQRWTFRPMSVKDCWHLRDRLMCVLSVMRVFWSCSGMKLVWASDSETLDIPGIDWHVYWLYVVMSEVVHTWTLVWASETVNRYWERCCCAQRGCYSPTSQCARLCSPASASVLRCDSVVSCLAWTWVLQTTAQAAKLRGLHVRRMHVSSWLLFV